MDPLIGENVILRLEDGSDDEEEALETLLLEP